ncbi:MAG: hemolysin III family protein [Betaproteobacteria bacterium]|nr:hemolysin III family protein [Betaproteobacteria bacterium]
MIYGERFNSISHLVGAVLAALGTAVLVVTASKLGDPWKIVSFSIYGAMLIVLYSSSSAYHSLGGRAKKVFRKFDHCSIYLLIAGSYTPFALVTLRGAWGWSLFGVIWGLALLGIVQELWLTQRTRAFSMVLYVLMGWLALVALLPLWRALSPAGFGGLFVVSQLATQSYRCFTFPSCCLVNESLKQTFVPNHPRYPKRHR